MQVYKTFFRIFRQHTKYVILYLCIFMGVAMLISSHLANEDGKREWEKVGYTFAVVDQDQSELSRGLISYISRRHERIEVEDREQTVTDELYEKNLNCFLRIPKGFGISARTGDGKKKVEMSAIRESVCEKAFQTLVEHYISLVRSYLAEGVDLTETLAEMKKVEDSTLPVTVEERGGDELHGCVYYFFLYLPYILISTCVVGIGPAVMVFQRREIRHRNQCSAYPDIRIHMEIMAAAVTVGIVLCVLYFLLVLLGTGGEVLSYKGFLHSINMISFLPSALGITFLAGLLFKKGSTLTMAANVIGIGLSFLGGVFVPMDYLGEDLEKAAHLLPVYWYETGNNLIDQYAAGDSLNMLWQCMGVELLFGVALVCAGLAYFRSRLRTVAM